jgi:5-methylcytosine-specific restriction endonuclease McrA
MAADKLHRDHFVPKSLGGISDIGNIVPACPTCNLHKHAKHPKDFLSPEKYRNIIETLSQLAKLD